MALCSFICFNQIRNGSRQYTCQTCVKHVYYINTFYAYITAVWITSKTLHMYHTCNTHVARLLMFSYQNKFACNVCEDTVEIVKQFNEMLHLVSWTYGTHSMLAYCIVLSTFRHLSFNNCNITLCGFCHTNNKQNGIKNETRV